MDLPAVSIRRAPRSRWRGRLQPRCAGPVCHHPAPAATWRAPVQQLARCERLRRVVVRAGVECADLLVLLVDRRQDDDRDGAPLARLSAHVDAVTPDGCIPDFLTLTLLDMAAPSGLSVRDP